MTTRQKFLLIAVTAVSVISDSMLIPFYPQYFVEVFALDDAHYVGFYLAVYCLVVMLSLPLWAAVVKRIALLPLLVVTQTLAAILSVACFLTDQLTWFWILSLSMMLFKASYLLVYPFLLSRETSDQHATTIGLLAVIVGFGAIFGALAGGVLLQWFDPRQAFLVMAVCDLIQIAVCIFLMGQGLDSRSIKDDADVANDVIPKHVVTKVGDKRQLISLAVVMLLFYFSAYLGYHFFTRYWSEIVPETSEFLSALVFAIPAAAALIGLGFNHYRRKPLQISALTSTILLAGIGALLQAMPHPWLLLLGRAVFGWAVFQSLVRFDLLLFLLSSPKCYAEDYSRVRIAQSLGVLLAAYAAGSIISQWGGAWMFVCSAIGLILALCSFAILFSPKRLSYAQSTS